MTVFLRSNRDSQVWLPKKPFAFDVFLRRWDVLSMVKYPPLLPLG